MKMMNAKMINEWIDSITDEYDDIHFFTSLYGDEEQGELYLSIHYWKSDKGKYHNCNLVTRIKEFVKINMNCLLDNVGDGDTCSTAFEVYKLKFNS